MLPFITKKYAQGGLTHVERRKPDEESTEDRDSIEYCAEDLLTAIEAKDTKGISKAMRDIFEILDSEPHQEGPHESDESD